MKAAPDHFKTLHFFFIWEVWIARNKATFEHCLADLGHFYEAIQGWTLVAITQHRNAKDLSIRLRPHPIELPATFFDGAQQGGLCMVGGWIKIDKGERYELQWHGGLDQIQRLK